MRILHTSDWQLGIGRAFLGPTAQARWAGDRLQAVRRLLTMAGEHRCDAVVVAGDVFEHHLVSDAVVTQAINVLGESPVPVVLLPGNHDPLDPASIYLTRATPDRLPRHVQVARQPGVIEPVDGLQLVVAPYPAKHPPADLLHQAIAGVEPAPAGVTRVLVAHGQVESYGGVGTIDQALLDDALTRNVVHYVALGDHHSCRQVDAAGRVWYSGTPEVTAFDEADPGWVLVVDIDPNEGTVDVEKQQTGHWRFIEHRAELTGDHDVDELHRWLAELPRRDLTVLRLRLHGQLDLAQRSRVDDMLDEGAADALVHAFAAVEVDDQALATVPDAVASADLGLVGFVADAAAELEGLAAGSGPDAATAAEALRLLYRLVHTSGGRP